MRQEKTKRTSWEGRGAGGCGEGGRGRWAEGDDGEKKSGTWASGIANRQISHGQRRYPIVTANAGRVFVTGARDGDSEFRKSSEMY